ncbi:MAG: DNA methyltransferase, partial [Rhodospirillaceae bacterium]
MFALDPATLSGRLSVPPMPRPQAGRQSRHDLSVPVYEQSLWTSRQRQASAIHEVSYRACFKPQLPRYFIERLTRAGDLVYDPFSGRGTTAVEAALMGRRVAANDINPLSAIFTLPRLEAPDLADIEERLRTLPVGRRRKADIDLSMFYHPDTERELLALREYLARHAAAGTEDSADRWIRMVATNRLTGHSPGFFSVYTLPPNQATTPENQVRINRKLKQRPEYRDTRALILRKSAQLLGRLTADERGTLRL